MIWALRGKPQAAPPLNPHSYRTWYRGYRWVSDAYHEMTPYPHRMTIISPSRSSLHSRTKKSILGKPIPILTMLTGTLLYVPVIVKNPRSECKAKSPESASLVIGLAILPTFPHTPPFNPNASCLSRYFAIVRARAGSPTVISITNTGQDPMNGQGINKRVSQFGLRLLQNGGQDGKPSHLWFLESLEGKPVFRVGTQSIVGDALALVIVSFIVGIYMR